MALDGVTISAIVCEIQEWAVGGRIDKASQPEKDEVILSIRSKGANKRLLLTASASHPRLHLTSAQKSNPAQAPLFCMVLRKQVVGGRIVGIEQPNFERIVELHVESRNEMGDLSTKKLIIEIMGKHSNIILTDENDIIIDSIKRITHEKSAVREVLPGKKYTRPPNKDKENPMLLDKNRFIERLAVKEQRAQDGFYKTFSGISPFLAYELCFRAGIDPDCDTRTNENVRHSMADALHSIMSDIQKRKYSYAILYENGKPTEFSCVPMTAYDFMEWRVYNSPSEMLEAFYSQRDSVYRVSCKTADMRRLIQQNIERCARKKDMYAQLMKDTQNRHVLKRKGELLTSYIHTVEKGMKSYTAADYYDDMKPLIIALDPDKTPSENAQSYFKRYNKKKRAYMALTEQTGQNNAELAYLESLLTALNNCQNESDIEELRDEMFEQGVLKKRTRAKGVKHRKSKPLHFVSSDGMDIYVGKNNLQNDDLTLRFAQSNDMWFHAKDMPGSHVIVRTNGEPPPISTMNQAALLAAFYSKGKNSSNVPVDYTTRKNVKKPSGAKPGMVIYDHYNTAYITPDEQIIKNIKLFES